MFCLNCSKSIKKNTKYCSNKCQKDYQYKDYINKWKHGNENGMRGEYQISSYIKHIYLISIIINVLDAVGVK